MMGNKLAQAIALASKAFEYTTDKGGQPYILHCIRVMNNLGPDADEEQKIMAILHDVPEDTDITIEMLRDYGYSDRVLRALVLLKHDKNVSYEAYIKLLSFNPDAVRVKQADLKDNTDITRLKGLTKKDFDRMEKYHQAWVYLSKI